jgi:hypothetical protein
MSDEAFTQSFYFLRTSLPVGVGDDNVNVVTFWFTASVSGGRNLVQNGTRVTK